MTWIGGVRSVFMKEQVLAYLKKKKLYIMKKDGCEDWHLYIDNSTEPNGVYYVFWSYEKL